MTSFWRYNIVFLMVIAHIVLTITAREDFHFILGAFAAAFVLYILVVEEYELKQVFYIAIALRLLWLFTTPNLSDDYYRFIWDGELTLNGINVFSSTPSDLIVTPEFSSELHNELYDGMNSKDYYSVYPPINQVYFILSGLISDSIFGRLLTLKLLFFLTEFIGLFVLFKLASSAQIVKDKFSLWALNPLVIVEGVGNLHFEVLVLVYILLAICYFKRNWWLSAIFYGVAISTKLLPLMFLPLLIPFFGWMKSIKYGAVAGGVFVLTFVPFMSLEILQNTWSSIDLYFQTFEFNASIYYIVRWIGELSFGWNIIQTAGPVMAGITILVIAIFSFTPKRYLKLNLPATALIVSTVYLLMSTTVHPWYALIPFGISLFSKHKYPFWWTGLIFLSYSFYLNGTAEEKPLFLFIEYGILFGLMGWGIVKRRKNKVVSSI